MSPVPAQLAKPAQPGKSRSAELKSKRYKFKPRFIGVALLSLSMGVTLIAASATVTPDRFSSLFALVSGAAGLFLSFTYLRSPVWRLSVQLQADDLVIWNGRAERLRLPWEAVVRVVVDPGRELCFVDGGSPDKSLLIPGPGAPASYTISNRLQLIEEILSHVPSSIVQDSATLEVPTECSTVPKA